MNSKLIAGIDIHAPGFPRDDVDSQKLANAQMSGHALAQFFLERMAERGYSDGELTAEDWGWHLSARDPGGEILVEVRFSSYGQIEHPDGFLVSVEPDRPTRRKMLVFKQDVRTEAERLSALVYDILSQTNGIAIEEAQFNEF